MGNIKIKFVFMKTNLYPLTDNLPIKKTINRNNQLFTTDCIHYKTNIINRFGHKIIRVY